MGIVNHNQERRRGRGGGGDHIALIHRGKFLSLFSWNRFSIRLRTYQTTA